jgi:ankyrin repeat protein
MYSTGKPGELADAAEGGSTALHIAAQDGYIDIVATLVSAGADLAAQDEEGKTALARVQERGAPELIRLLKAQ